MNRRRASSWSLIGLLGGMVIAIGMANPTTAAPGEADDVLLVEPNGRWHIRVPGEADYTFWYGIPGDVALFGDWDGDGFDSPGMYRPSTGFVYLSNLIPPDGGVGFGDPALTYFFGDPGDQVFVGDWDDNGTDTLGISRRGRMHLSNIHRTVLAEEEFWFGVPTDTALGGAATGEGDGVFLLRPSTGFVYYTAVIPAGELAATSGDFFFGDPGDLLVVGDWDGDGGDTAGLFRASDGSIHLRNTLNTGPADITYTWGQPSWVPVAGRPDLHNPPATFELTTTWGGVSGAVVTSSPPGISCANSRLAVCRVSFPAGTEVTLTALPAAGSRLVEWIGAECGSADSCSIAMNTDLLVHPTFSPWLPIRVNAGGPLIPATDGGPDWMQDTVQDPSVYVNFTASDPDNVSATWPLPSLHGLVPSSTPAAVFSSERWDGPGDSPMHWNFPVERDQWVEVRLYFASGFPAASDLAERLFDVSLDGWLVLDDYDIVADVGHQLGVMKRFVVKADADGLDVVFGHLNPAVQNPLINAIEIVAPERLAVVSPAADPELSGSALLVALASVSSQGPGPGREWIVKVEPGEYELGDLPLEMVPYVEIEGSGQAATILRRSGGDPNPERGVVVGADHAALRHVTLDRRLVPGSLGSGNRLGIFNENASPRIEAVTIEVLSGCGAGGIHNRGGAPIIRDITITTDGRSCGAGTSGIVSDNSEVSIANFDITGLSDWPGSARTIASTGGVLTLTHGTIDAPVTGWAGLGVTTNGAVAYLKDVAIHATGGWHVALGVGVTASTLWLENVSISVAVDSTISYGVIARDSTVVMSNVTVDNTGGGPPYAVYLLNTDATLDNVELSSREPNFNTGWGLYSLGDGSSNSVVVDNSTIRAPSSTVRTEAGITTLVTNSILDGGPVIGTVTCQNVRDEHGTLYPDSCPD